MLGMVSRVKPYTTVDHTPFKTLSRRMRERPPLAGRGIAPSHVTFCRAWKRSSRQRPVAMIRCSVSAARQVSVKLM